MNFRKTAIAALSAIALVSCIKEVAPVEEGLSGATLVFSSEAVQQSVKTNWDGNAIQWTVGDKIAMAYNDKGTWSSQVFVSDPLAQAGTKAQFSVKTSLEKGYKSTLDFYAVCPSAAAGTFASAPQLQVEIPASQTPLAESYDPAADLMYGYTVESVKTVSETPVSLFWRRLVAHADITMTMPAIRQNETVKSIDFQTDAQLAGTYTIDMTTGKLQAKTASKTISVNPEKLNVKDGKMRIWLAMLPCKVTSMTVTIRTDKSSYVRTISSCNLEFDSNKRNMLGVDMSSAVYAPDTDPAKNALINKRLFDVINLDAPGLENVKSLYEYGCIYEAVQELKSYYSNRTDVSVPLVNLSSNRYTTTQKWIADQALKENGYRFYIASNEAYREGTSDQGDIYFSFLDKDGGVNWELRPTSEDMFVQHLHRHPWIATQGLVYWGTKDEKYARSIVEVYSDWLKTYPCPVAGKDSYYMGMGHTDYRRWCNLQACARVETYIKVLQYCKDSESFTPEFISDLLVSLYDSVECIRANYYYTDSGNIRQSETQAVLNMAVMMPEYKKAGEWLDEAIDDTERFLDELLMDDGVLVEKDLSYHIGVIATFYEAHNILAANGKESLLPADYFARLKNGVCFVRDMIYPDYSVEDFNDTRSASWTESVLTKNFVKYSEMFPDDQTLKWFATGRASGSAPTELLSLYKTSGWYMFRTGWQPSDMMLILKNNENSFGYAHCQNDNGTISLYRNGRRFLPDAGVYTYGGSDEDDALREQFRQTKMHNTMTYKGGNSVNNNVENCGIFKSSAQTEEYDKVHVSNQSYGALRHERVVYRMKDGFFVVIDMAIGSSTGSVELNWHMCPGDVDYIRDSNTYEARTKFTDGNNMSFKTFCFNALYKVTDFVSTPRTSWCSNIPGTKKERPCHTVAINKSTTANPVRFITVIYPFDKASQLPQISAMFNSVSMVTVTIGNKEYTLTI